MTYLYRLDPYRRHLVWGGEYLESVLGRGKGKGPLAEALELSGLADMPSLVMGGPDDGRPFADVLLDDPVGVVGRSANAVPVLIKRIDAASDLSVQLHPNDEKAEQLENERYGKTEAWVVLRCDDDAAVYLGFKDGVSRADVATAIAEERLTDLLRRIAVAPGDVIPVKAGCVHAILGGIVIFEAQQPSNLTYRLYDYGRVGLDNKPRELHIDRGLQCLDVGLRPQKCEASPVEGDPGLGAELLVDMGPFRIERWRPDSLATRALDRMHAIHVIAGALTITAETESLALPCGATGVAAARAGTLTVFAEEDTEALVVVPD